MSKIRSTNTVNEIQLLDPILRGLKHSDPLQLPPTKESYIQLLDPILRGLKHHVGRQTISGQDIQLLDPILRGLKRPSAPQ